MIYSFDMDGTLCTNVRRTARLREVGRVCDLNEELISRLMSDVADDDETPLIELARTLTLTHKVVVVTGRPAACKRATILWLYKHGVFVASVHTRRPGECGVVAHEWKQHALRVFRASVQEDVVHFDDDPLLVVPEGVHFVRVGDQEHHVV